MKEGFHKMRESLLAEFKKELDERNAGYPGFMNMKMLMEKIDDMGIRCKTILMTMC